MLETVFAQNIQDLAPNPNLTSYGLIVSVVIKNAFMLAGVISFLLLIVGGFTIISSAGDPKKTQQGKAAITGAVSGLMLVLGSYLIMQILDVITGQQIFHFLQ